MRSWPDPVSPCPLRYRGPSVYSPLALLYIGGALSSRAFACVLPFAFAVPLFIVCSLIVIFLSSTPDVADTDEAGALVVSGGNAFTGEDQPVAKDVVGDDANMEEVLHGRALLRTSINVELGPEDAILAEAGGALHVAFISGGRRTSMSLVMRCSSGTKPRSIIH